MPGPLRILLVEDNPDDAELVLRQLSRAGFELRPRRVEDADELIEALDTDEWDIILADYNMPGFSGLDAMNIVSRRDLDTPLVLVSGAIDVPTALMAMKAGARDFILKDDTQRLPSVVDREVQEAAQRRQRRIAEKERDQALADLRESSDQLAAFAALADIAIGSATLDHFVGDVLARVVDASGADGAVILLLEGDELVTRGAVGPTAGVERVVPLGSGFAGVVAAEDRPLFVADAQNDLPAIDSVVAGCGVSSTMGVPMHYAGRVSGVLLVDWCAPFQPQPWQLPLLEIAADRCATLIENARLFEQEHAIAQTLQQALLSAATNIPQLEVGHFYASATIETMVGGDFYDVFELDDCRIAFSIGDVSGKGLEAAKITALVKNALRTIAVEGAPPDEVMRKINDVVGRFTRHDSFVTAVFGVLDVRSGEVAYSVAGHPPPAIIGPQGMRTLEFGGPLLGALPGMSYPHDTSCLVSGDSIVLYTDGLTEARSPEGEFFGEERLREFLSVLAGTNASPQELATRIFDHVWEFSGGKLRDDIALVVLRPALRD